MSLEELAEALLPAAKDEYDLTLLVHLTEGRNVLDADRVCRMAQDSPWPIRQEWCRQLAMRRQSNGEAGSP